MNHTDITDVSSDPDGAWLQVVVTHRFLFGGVVTDARRAGQIKWVRKRLWEHGRDLDNMECTDVRTKDNETQFSFKIPCTST